MKEDKLFLDENISLRQLAEILNIHPNYLSQVVNVHFKKNFYDFINSYRVEEFKRLVVLPENKKKTFFALAYDCGFNSKASFNNSFKKLTGTTPTEFLKHQ
jgi:YesN/AraC family two-component response regulator